MKKEIKKQPGQDCPYSNFEPFDLLYSSMGSYECRIRGIEYGQYGDPTGNFICHEENHLKCASYLYQKDLEKKQQEEKKKTLAEKLEAKNG